MYENICGPTPINFIKIVPEGSNYIFTKDPNFIPITLKNFFNSVVQVNSFEECYYYAELGWSISKITIFEIAEYLVIFFLIIFFAYITVRNKASINKLISSIKKISFDSNLQKILLFFYLLIQAIITFNYVKNKSLDLKPFIDEYVSLSSNYHFFTEFDYNAGGFLGDTFSVYLTSGPVSAVGSVLGWIFFENIYISRIFNYFWIVILLFLFFLVVKNVNKLNQNYYLLFIFQIILLVPWWQGSLYSLGEISSLILIAMAMLVSQKNRKLSLILFGLSIFLGKFLNIIIFSIFYIFIFLNERSIKQLTKDALFFLTFLIPWFILINLTYQKGNVVSYFFDLYYFVTDSSASGVQTSSIFNYSELKLTVLRSEFSSWNIYEKIRIGIFPLISIYLIIKNRKFINTVFGKVSYAIAFSTMFIYLWFWILNPLKWMRYSQHFTVLSILLLLSFIVFEVFKQKTDYLISFIMLTFYLDNSKKYYIYYLIIIISMYIFLNKKFYRPTSIIFMSLLITFDLSISVFNKDLQIIPDINIQNCENGLNTDSCREGYLSLLYE